jgi:hypothetical protein
MATLVRALIPCLIGMLLASPAAAERRCAPGERGPYGDYCPGPQSGWYGAGTAIATAEQAKKVLTAYFGSGATVTVTGETGCFFEAEIVEGGKLKDRVIIHKKNGRIRSIY